MFGHGVDMLKLEELIKGTQVVGIDPAGPVAIVTADAIGEDAVSVWYKASDGSPTERMLFRSDEAKLAVATVVFAPMRPAPPVRRERLIRLRGPLGPLRISKNATYEPSAISKVR